MKQKVIFLTITAVLISFILIALLIIIKHDNNKELNTYYKEDSLLVFSLGKDEIYNLFKLQGIERIINLHSKDNSHNYKKLFDYLDSLKFEYSFGTYYFDEFTNELLSAKESKVILSYNQADSLGYKYKSTKIAKGYKSAINKKAHKLQKEYGWSKEECLNIISHKYWIGMDKQMVIKSLGNPTKINKTVTSSVIREQWVYRNYDMYLYFENGILSTYQN